MGARAAGRQRRPPPPPPPPLADPSAAWLLQCCCRQRQLINLGLRVPTVAPDTWVAPNAVIVGDVDLYDRVSPERLVWRLQCV